MTLDDLDHIVGVGHIFADVVVDHFALVGRVEDGLLHHALADGGHLRTVFGIDDGRHDVAAECRTDLIENILVDLVVLLVLELADFERGAVGRQTAEERRRHARAQVAAYDGGAHQAYLRLLGLEEVDQHGGVRQRCVGIEPRSVKDVNHVHTIGEHLLFDSLQVAACHYGFELAAETVGQRATLGEQFEADVGHGALFQFAIYK